jgi:dephospho-CoA kinase
VGEGVVRDDAAGEGLLILLMGRIAAGKSTLAETLATQLGCRSYTASTTIRRAAEALGLAPIRHVLQDLGTVLVRESPDAFAASLLEDGGWDIGATLIVEGVRQRQVAECLRRQVHPAEVMTVFLSAPFEVRAARVSLRDGVSRDEFSLSDRHPVEEEIDLLADTADLLLDATLPPGALADGVLTRLNQ